MKCGDSGTRPAARPKELEIFVPEYNADRESFRINLATRIVWIWAIHSILDALAVLLMWQQYRIAEEAHLKVSLASLALSSGVRFFTIALLTPPIFWVVAKAPISAGKLVRRTMYYLAGFIPFVLSVCRDPLESAAALVSGNAAVGAPYVGGFDWPDLHHLRR